MSRVLVLLVLALIFGGLPAARQYLYGLTVVEGHGQQITTPVIMYTTPWCPYCHRAREYFKRHSVNYVEYDIEASAEHLAKFQDLNGTAVPLILAGDRRMQGFSPKSFDDLLK
jgi:glutaredoxin